MPRPKHSEAYRARRKRMREARHMRDVYRRLAEWGDRMRELRAEQEKKEG